MNRKQRRRHLQRPNNQFLTKIQGKTLNISEFSTEHAPKFDLREFYDQTPTSRSYDKIHALVHLQLEHMFKRIWSVIQANKWKHRKARARKHAQTRKLTRGRSSGASDKDTRPASKLRDLGYAKWEALLGRIQ